MIGIVERLRFDATRCELRATKGQMVELVAEVLRISAEED